MISAIKKLETIETIRTLRKGVRLGKKLKIKDMIQDGRIGDSTND